MEGLPFYLANVNVRKKRISRTEKQRNREIEKQRNSLHIYYNSSKHTCKWRCLLSKSKSENVLYIRKVRITSNQCCSSPLIL